MPKSFESQIHEIISSVPKDNHLAPETSIIANQAILDLDVRYGPESDNPLRYHNAQHGIDVMRRGVRLSRILEPFMEQRYRNKLYDLVIVGSGLHDYEQGEGVEVFESLSATDAIKRVEGADGQLNNGLFKRRLRRGILATTVRMDNDGDIIQTKLLKGSHDPLKLIMAYADINGIAMEGGARMIRDARNLCDEIYGDPTPEQRSQFISDQESFMRRRLNDNRIKPEIAYYFPDNNDEVYKKCRKIFRHKIKQTMGTAKLLNRVSSLRDAASQTKHGDAAVLKSLARKLRSHNT